MQYQVHQFYDWLKVLAKKQDVQFDMHGFYKTETKITFQKSHLKNNILAQEQHINLRVIQGDKQGFSYSKDFSKANLEQCFQQAINSLNICDKKTAGSLSPKETYKNFFDYYNKDFKNVHKDDKIQKAQAMNQACHDSDPKVQVSFSGISDWYKKEFFINSSLVNSTYETNHIFAYCQALATEGDNRVSYLNHMTAKDYKDIDFVSLGKESSKKALKKMNYSVPKTGKYPAIFQSGQVSALFLQMLINLLNGLVVFEGLSLLKDLFKKKVFSDLVCIQDDPFALWGLNSKPFDGEGFATEKTSLIQNGVLENYLTSSFFAKALKVPHTKKACWDATSKLHMSANNIILSEGQNSLQDMLNTYSQVFVIDSISSFEGCNKISGNFSIPAEGFLWKDGEAQAMSKFLISGNIKNVFANILKISNDSKIYNLSYGFIKSSIKSPSFLLAELIISGK